MYRIKALLDIHGFQLTLKTLEKINCVNQGLTV